MLLHKVTEAQSFEDLRTYNSITYQTFKEACKARGLLDDDNEWHEALSEASTWASSFKLRNMFAAMLLLSEITDPDRLWEVHCMSMVNDLRYRLKKDTNSNFNVSDEQLKEWGLKEIEQILNQNGKTLADFPPMPVPSYTSFGPITNRLIREELDYNRMIEEKSFQSYYRGLNSDQLRVYKAIIEAHKKNSGGFFFINDIGGTGKTYLWKKLVAKLRSENKIVLSVASSGIASLLLPGGRTAHSRFKIPFDLHESSTCSITVKTELAQLIEHSSMVIWDEAPMMHRYGFEALHTTLKDLLKNTENFSADKPFGGKLFVLGGDFKQILPVVVKGRREAVVATSLHKSKLWRHCKVMHLTINMRLTAHGNSRTSIEKLRSFAEWINMVGEGTTNNVHLRQMGESDWIEIDKEFLIENKDDSLLQLILATYPNLQNMFKDSSYLRERAILAPKNSDVDAINTIMSSMIPGESRKFYSADKVCLFESRSVEENIHPPELLNAIKISGLPDHCLELKEGAPIML